MISSVSKSQLTVDVKPIIKIPIPIPFIDGSVHTVEMTVSLEDVPNQHHEYVIQYLRAMKLL